MNFIRPGTEPKWVDEAETGGLYVYGDGEQLVYMPTTEEEFVEVTMRMLEQADHLDDEELERVFQAFAYRLRWESKDRDLSRNDTRSDAYFDMTTPVAWMKDRDGWEDEYAQAKEIWKKLDPRGEIEKDSDA